MGVFDRRMGLRTVVITTRSVLPNAELARHNLTCGCSRKPYRRC